MAEHSRATVALLAPLVSLALGGSPGTGAPSHIIAGSYFPVKMTGVLL